MRALAAACMLAACAGPAQRLRLAPGLELDLRLPPECEHWRAVLESEAADVARGFAQAAARWPQAQPAFARAEPLHVAVAADAEAAAALYAALQLDGDARVARSFPELRLAVIPLPRADPLLTGRNLPPLTWRETFRHELAHLMSLDRPGLRAAPVWFQEGIAESLAQRAGPAPLSGSRAVGLLALRDFLAAQEPDRPGLEAIAQAPGEARLAAWSLAAAAACAAVAADPAPWRAVEAWTVAEFQARLPLSLPELPPFVGREVDPPGLAGERELLLASWPGETVAARLLLEDLPRFSVQVGRTGVPEAGCVITGAGDQQLRLRFSKYGGVAAALEPKGAAETHALQGAPPDGAIGAPRPFELELRSDVLRVRSGGWEQSFALDPLHFGPPLRLEFYVRDGALRVAAP